MDRATDPIFDRLDEDHRAIALMVGQIKDLCQRKDLDQNCLNCPPRNIDHCYARTSILVENLLLTLIRHNSIEETYLANAANKEIKLQHMRTHRELAEMVFDLKRRRLYGENGISDFVFCLEKFERQFHFHVASEDSFFKLH